MKKRKFIRLLFAFLCTTIALQLLRNYSLPTLWRMGAKE